MTAVPEREPQRCRFCAATPALMPGHWERQDSFYGDSYWTCPKHTAVPYPSCKTPDRCKGSCLAEYACND